MSSHNDISTLVSKSSEQKENHICKKILGGENEYQCIASISKKKKEGSLENRRK